MPQTENTLRALQRDGHLCQWCLYEKKRIRRTVTGHHILGRSKSDMVEDIIALCRECHEMAHRREISKKQLQGLIWNADFDRGNRNYRRIKRREKYGSKRRARTN